MSLRYTHRGDLPETLDRIEAKLAELNAVPRTEWACATCRTRWSQDGSIHINVACTICVPPYYAGDWLYPLGTEDATALNAQRPAAKDEPR